MKIHSMVFKNRKEIFEYRESHKDIYHSLESEFEDGQILATFVSNSIWAFISEEESFNFAIKIHAAALSSYLASGGQLKEL